MINNGDNKLGNNALEQIIKEIDNKVQNLRLDNIDNLDNLDIIIHKEYFENIFSSLLKDKLIEQLFSIKIN